MPAMNGNDHREEENAAVEIDGANIWNAGGSETTSGAMVSAGEYKSRRRRQRWPENAFSE